MTPSRPSSPPRLAAGLLAAALLTACPEAIRQPPYDRAGRAEPAEGVHVAHALGAIDGAIYTNSLEALELNYERGYRWFEVDLSFTADGDLVCFHERYEKNLDLDVAVGEATTEEFLAKKYNGSYTLLTFKQLLEETRDRPDLVLVTDTKELTPQILAALESDIDSVDPQLRQRIVLQMYHADELDFILEAERNAGRFGGVIFTLYLTRISEADLLAFVEVSGIEWITLSNKRFNPGLGAGLQELGARVFVHTLNEPEDIASFFAAGVDGIYTDGLKLPPPTR